MIEFKPYFIDREVELKDVKTRVRRWNTYKDWNNINNWLNTKPSNKEVINKMHNLIDKRRGYHYQKVSTINKLAIDVLFNQLKKGY